jgi:hypothetical protein
MFSILLIYSLIFTKMQGLDPVFIKSEMNISINQA